RRARRAGTSPRRGRIPRIATVAPASRPRQRPRRRALLGRLVEEPQVGLDDAELVALADLEIGARDARDDRLGGQLALLARTGHGLAHAVDGLAIHDPLGAEI